MNKPSKAKALYLSAFRRQSFVFVSVKHSWQEGEVGLFPRTFYSTAAIVSSRQSRLQLRSLYDSVSADSGAEFSERTC